jgi:hypothetical protein
MNESEHFEIVKLESFIEEDKVWNCSNHVEEEETSQVVD